MSIAILGRWRACGYLEFVLNVSLSCLHALAFYSYLPRVHWNRIVSLFRSQFAIESRRADRSRSTGSEERRRIFEENTRLLWQGMSLIFARDVRSRKIVDWRRWFRLIWKWLAFNFRRGYTHLLSYLSYKSYRVGYFSCTLTFAIFLGNDRFGCWRVYACKHDFISLRRWLFTKCHLLRLSKTHLILWSRCRHTILSFPCLHYFSLLLLRISDMLRSLSLFHLAAKVIEEKKNRREREKERETRSKERALPGWCILETLSF